MKIIRNRKRFRIQVLKILTFTHNIYNMNIYFSSVGYTINSINLNKQE